MFIRLQSSSGVPITRQIADQIRNLSASGAIRPGDRLPSVRQLAKDLAVNPNTILRVYERLTSDGLLERRHGDGTYLADIPPRGQAKAQHEFLAREFDSLARHIADLNLSVDEAHKLLDQAMNGLTKKPTERAKP